MFHSDSHGHLQSGSPPWPTWRRQHRAGSGLRALSPTSHPVPCPPQRPPTPSSGSQGPPSIPPLGVPAPAPPLLPVAQDLRVGRGLTGKDDALALLHRLGLYRQGHCRGVCKAEDGRSGPFLSLTFLFLSLAHTLRPHPCGDLGI